MKSKQLANVLIKILGLSVCIHAIPAFVSRILAVLTSFQMSRADLLIMQLFTSAVGAAVEAALGIALIVLSQKIADLMFKNEAE